MKHQDKVYYQTMFHTGEGGIALLDAHTWKSYLEDILRSDCSNRWKPVACHGVQENANPRGPLSLMVDTADKVHLPLASTLVVPLDCI